MENITNPDAANKAIDQPDKAYRTQRKHRCRHIMPQGIPCGSPAVRGEALCYHHNTIGRPPVSPTEVRARRARQHSFSIASPRSRAELQDALATVISNLAGNDIDLRRAGLLLYALQIANCNLTEHQR